MVRCLKMLYNVRPSLYSVNKYTFWRLSIMFMTAFMTAWEVVPFDIKFNVLYKKQQEH